MARPYSQILTVDLEKLFAEKSEEKSVMRDLLHELSYRKKNKAKQLRDQVEKHLAKMKNSPSKPHQPKNKPKISDLFSKEPCSSAGSESSSAAPKTQSELPLKTSKKKQKSAAPSVSGDAGASPDDRDLPKKFTKIFAPGVKGRPSPYIPQLKTDLIIELPEGATRIQKFVAGLDALISEMRRDGSGNRRYELEHGTLVEAVGGQPIYSFQFPEGADIFEDAKIEVEFNARRSGGQIVSISEGRLLLTLEDNLGESIRRCILIIDNTALIESLKERLEQAAKGELALSLSLAESVASKNSSHSKAEPIEYPDHKFQLNTGQKDALKLMLKRSVSYLWGPPGTGKTQTLALAIQAAFDSEKRILVCSNTNQAVDELLLKLCRHLKSTKHRALEDGKVVRVGNIVHGELKEEHEVDITIEGITERLSKELKERQRKLENQVVKIDVKMEPVNERLRLFVHLDEKESELISLGNQFNVHVNTLKEAKALYGKAEKRIAKCRMEKQEWKTAGKLRRTILRSEEKITEDIRRTESEIARHQSVIQNTETNVTTVEIKINETQSQVKSLKSQLSGKDREKLETEKKVLEDERQPLVTELQEIAGKLAEVEAAIMRDARVIGATVTKSYVSVQDFGKFDFIVIDEASMVLLPALYFVAGLSTERVVVSGDFRQIPPIVPSREQAVHDLIGGDIFQSAGIDGNKDSRCAMLDVQYRMTDKICRLIAKDIYGGNLKTFEGREADAGPMPPAPYNQPLTIIDTSKLWPFESRNILGSRFNLLNALLVRNLVGHFEASGYLNGQGTLGICTPYAAQSKLLQQLTEAETKHVTAGTVHYYQGGERKMMILDIPESIGPSWNIGQFLQGVKPEHSGSRLFNVAVSRAKEHLIVLANLTYLDKKLPSTAFLRSILYNMQEQGRVIDAADVMELRPIERDLKNLLGVIELDLDAEKLGLFHSKTFSDACFQDMQQAKKSIVIFSGFVTPQRVEFYGDLFRVKIAEGVAIRCVTRPPQLNGSIPRDLGEEALDALEGIGVTVDCRRAIHEKIVLIDNRIVWSGSLNPLSHTFRTDEFMTRAEAEGYAERVAEFISKRIGVAPGKLAAQAAEAENPRCPACKSRTFYSDGPHGPYYTCERQDECGWKKNAKAAFQEEKAPVDPSLPKKGPPCPECGGPTKLRSGSYGPFYGCLKYPKCKGISKLAKKKKQSKAKGGTKRQPNTKSRRNRK